MHVPVPNGGTCGSSTAFGSARATAMSWYFAVAWRSSAIEDWPPPAAAKPAIPSTGTTTASVPSSSFLRMAPPPSQTVSTTGSGRTTTVSATRTISSTGRSAATAWRRIASGLDAW